MHYSSYFVLSSLFSVYPWQGDKWETSEKLTYFKAQACAHLFADCGSFRRIFNAAVPNSSFKWFFRYFIIVNRIPEDRVYCRLIVRDRSLNWIFLSSRLLRNVRWCKTDVSGQYIGPIFKGNNPEDWKIQSADWSCENITMITQLHKLESRHTSHQLVDFFYLTVIVEPNT